MKVNPISPFVYSAIASDGRRKTAYAGFGTDGGNAFCVCFAHLQLVFVPVRIVVAAAQVIMTAVQVIGTLARVAETAVQVLGTP